MKEIFLEAHIADIHFGRLDPKVQYDILCEQFISKIQVLNLDIISINGDLFDHKFMTNSDAVMYASEFIDQLVMYCRRTGCTLLILHGTMSHDSNQLKIFYKYQHDSSVDVRIIETAKLEIVNDKRILCIPELYGMKTEYWENVLYGNGYYDSAILHGTIVGSIYGADHEDLDSDKGAVFSINNFGFCKGPIICGHVHVPQCLNNDIYYCGSPIRDRFGEEQPKGFSILMHNLITGEYHMHFEEIKSFRYDTVNLDAMVADDPQNVIRYIDNLKSQGIDYLRVIFTLNGDAIPIIKEHYSLNKDIIIKAEFQSRQSLARDKEIKEKYEQYSYILDKNLSEYDILCKYINQNMGSTYITVDELKKLLSDV